MNPIHLGIASDHAGKELRRHVIDFVKMLGHEVTDYGIGFDVSQSVDYPDYASHVADAISKKAVQKGILICGTGLGMCITANKFKGVRAALIHDEFTAKMSAAHNNANIICLGSRTLNFHRACDFTKLWLETPFEGERHQQRINKIHQHES